MRFKLWDVETKDGCVVAYSAPWLDADQVTMQLRRMLRSGIERTRLRGTYQFIAADELENEIAYAAREQP